jgi:DeoR/GlpR family transcriptional regulator of sugar metabolism
MLMVNHKHWHYDRHWGWQPIKARKLQVLEFIYDRKFVTAYDLMEQFGYTYSSARCRLCQLRKEGFIVSFGRGQWCLTDRAYRKLRYHGVLQRKETEELRRQRRAEGRVWLVDAGRVRMARNDSELAVAVTLNEALKAVRELRKEGLI